MKLYLQPMSEAGQNEDRILNCVSSLFQRKDSEPSDYDRRTLCYLKKGDLEKALQGFTDVVSPGRGEANIYSLNLFQF